MRTNRPYSLILAGMLSLAMGRPALADSWYVDGAAGSDAGSGLSWEQAKKTIGAANVLVGLAGNGAHTLCIKGDYTYMETISTPAGGTSDTARLIYQGVPGDGAGMLPVVSSGTNYPAGGFTLADGQAYTYQIAETGSILGVHEAPPASEEWRHYAPAASVAGVESSAGSYYLDGGILYLHTFNGSHPSNFNLVASRLSGDLFYIRHPYVSIQNFRIRLARQYAVNGATAGSGSRDLNLISNVISGTLTNFYPIGVFSSNACITYNTICYNAGFSTIPGSAAIRFNNVQNGTAAFNTIYSNACYGIMFHYATNCAAGGNTVFSNKLHGIYAYFGDNAAHRISGNMVRDHSEYNVYVNNSSGVVLSNNILRASKAGIYCNASTNCAIVNNTCSEHSNAGLYLYGACNDSMLANNTCCSNVCGLYFRAITAGPCYIYNNAIFRNTSAGAWFRDAHNMRLYNNTFFADAAYEITFNSGTANNMVLFNNIISATNTACFYQPPATLQSDYNDYYLSGPAKVSADYGTLAAWQSGTGQDGNSISADPLFLGVTPPDLHIAYRSPCRSRGIGVFAGISAPSHDQDGKAWFAAGLDIGCFRALPPAGSIMIVR